MDLRGRIERRIELLKQVIQELQQVLQLSESEVPHKAIDFRSAICSPSPRPELLLSDPRSEGDQRATGKPGRSAELVSSQQLQTAIALCDPGGRSETSRRDRTEVRPRRRRTPEDPGVRMVLQGETARPDESVDTDRGGTVGDDPVSTGHRLITPIGMSYGLHPSTEPGAIRTEQQSVVRLALATLGPEATVEQISAACVLPVWSVKCRIQELGSHG